MKIILVSECKTCPIRALKRIILTSQGLKEIHVCRYDKEERELSGDNIPIWCPLTDVYKKEVGE